MKTIKELSEDLGISRVALYKKLNYSLKEELTGHVFKIENKTYIDDDGEQIIFNSLKTERQEMVRTNDEIACTDLSGLCLPDPIRNSVVIQADSTVNQVNVLKAELAEKDRLIRELMQQNIDLINIFNVHDNLQIQEKLLLVKMHELSHEVHKPRFFSRMFGEKALKR